MTHSIFWDSMVKGSPIKLNGTPWTLTGESWAARYTSHEIPELGIMFDCGQKYTEQKGAKVIFISHAHCDHVGGLSTLLLQPSEQITVIVPKPSTDKIINMVQSYHKMTKNKDIVNINWKIIEASIPSNTTERIFLQEEITIKNVKFKIELFKSTHTIPTTGYGIIEQKIECVEFSNKTSENSVNKNINKVINEFNEINEINDILENNGIDMECDNYDDNISYGLIEMRSKLNDDLIGKSVDEIINAKNENKYINKIIEIPHICYLGDTTHHVFYLDDKFTEENPEIKKFRTILVECTFLFEDDIKKAKNKKHMHWNNLIIYIKNNPQINFILTHFSAKYKPVQIKHFFSKLDLKNVFPLIHDINEFMAAKFFNMIKNGDYDNELIKCIECSSTSEVDAFMNVINKINNNCENNKKKDK